MSEAQHRWLKNHGPGVLAIALLAVFYFLTLLSGLHEFGDITKAQFLGKFLGMTHPTGYPLYILLTAPFAHVPVGDLAWRINAFSALCGLGAAWFLYLTMCEQLVRPTVAAVCAAAFGLSGTAWSQFVIAEVYALNAVLVGAVLYFLTRWLHREQARDFVIACGIYSLSFGNHLTVVTLLPALALALALGRYRAVLKGRIVAIVLGCILLGASQYLYLFWASESDSLYLEYRVRTFDEFIEFVSGERYRRLMFAFEWQEALTRRLPQFSAQLVRDLGVVALVAPLGAAVFRSSETASTREGAQRRAMGVLVVAAVGQLLWIIQYDIPDIEVYTIPLAWLLAAMAGQGLELLAARSRVANGLVLLAALASVWVLAEVHLPNHKKAKRFSRRIDAALELMGEDAALVSRIHYSPRMAFVYRIYAEGLHEKRDLHLVYSAPAKRVERYLRGKPTLKDSHTHEQLPVGMRLFVDSRGRKQDWGRELRLVRRKAGLWEIRLR